MDSLIDFNSFFSEFSFAEFLESRKFPHHLPPPHNQSLSKRTSRQFIHDELPALISVRVKKSRRVLAQKTARVKLNRQIVGRAARRPCTQLSRSTSTHWAPPTPT